MLVDRFNYHQFQPLFYQVATAGLDASNISFPLRKVFHKSNNIHFRMAVVKEIKAGENRIITDAGEEKYDVLVIATGADTNFFGNQNLIDNAFPMKSTVEALQIRHRLIQNFEDALAAKDLNNDKAIQQHEDVEESLSIVDKEKELIIKALKKHRGKRRDASLDLGISERTLYRKLKEYDIENL